MSKVGFIGIGNMGYASLKGLLKKYNKQNIIVTDVNAKRMAEVVEETGVGYVSTDVDIVKQAKYVILAVKPQYYSGVLNNIKDVMTAEHVLISIAPGISIEDLKASLGQDKRIVRAMPNTPALVGEGMSGVSYDKNLFSDEEKATIRMFFESFGKMQLVEEKMMNVMACASSSAPAYVFMFIEALADSVVKYGMPRDMAYKTIAQAVKGSAELVLQTGEHPGKLKDQVCSPGGITIASVSALEEHGLRNAIIKATDACYEKCNDIK